MFHGRSRAAGWALLVALLAASVRPSGADDPPADPPATPPVTGPVTDPDGSATSWVADVEAAFARGHLVPATDALLKAWQRAPDALVPAPSVVAGTEGLRWRVRDVVEVWAGRLPPSHRALLEARRRAEGGTRDLERAQHGDVAALRRLCAPPVVADAEAEALLTLAEHEREDGRPAEAAALLGRWARARPDAPPERRARVLLRRAEALAAAGHVAGLVALLASPEPELDAAVPRAGATATVRARIEEALQSLRAPSPVAPDPVSAPKDLVALWSLDLTDSRLRGAQPDLGLVTPGTWAEEDVLLVNAARTVRRIEPLTGRELWRFPDRPQGWDYDPRAKYAPHDVALRTVVRAGDLALAILGDPGGTGAFQHQGADVELGGTIRESRARLVALDLATGRLRWTTGSARERHPVLADRGTCCSGPPLVVGERVYVLFGRRFGVVEHYAACLERATGALRWLAFVGVAESGRDPGSRSARGERVDRAEARAVPWGAAPTLADGELCVTPHAALAAGLDPETGSVRWVRGLPRYYERQFEDLGFVLPMTRGHGARNAPLAAPGTWVLAPMDCPVMVGLEQGTGLLAWSSAPPPEGRAAPFRDMLGLGRDPEGRLAVRMGGLSPALVDPFDGSIDHLGTWWDLDLDLPGRALDVGGAAVRAAEGELRFAPWPGGADAALVRVPLPASVGEADALDFDRVIGGDLTRAGPVWLAVEDEHVRAYAERETVVAALTRVIDDAARPAPERSAARAARARVVRSTADLIAAAEESDDPSARAVAAEAAAVAFEVEAGWPPQELLDAAPTLLPRLPAPARDRAFLGAARFLPRDVRLLAGWIDAPPALLQDRALEDDPDLRVERRGDLVAAALLANLRRTAATLPEGAEKAALLADLAAHDREALARVEAALLTDDEAALREAIRRAAATPAATIGRTTLAKRLAAAGRPGDAAAVAADLRLDPPPDVTGEARRVWCARRQLEEAGWLAEAGDVPAARSLLADLLRWVPSGLRDETGRSTSEFAADLAARTAWTIHPSARPERSIDVWGPEVLRPEHDEQAAVAFLGVEGPGAERQGDRALLARGLRLEVWSPSSGTRVATLPGEDEGWFGGTLQDLAPWLPEGGVRVTALVAGQPADTAGVRVGDWITSWNGVPLRGSADFLARIASSTPGRPAAVEVLRQGEQVVAALTPGRRPVGEGVGIVDRTHCWAAADGRVLVPGRTGLAWVDPVKAERTPLWRWTGTGTIARADVLAGTAYALVRRFHDDDLVVAVDPSTGRERWRTAVPGAVAWVRATGSALHVQVEDPARAYLLDRHDGGVRAVLPRLEHPNTRRDFRGGDLTLARAETAASAAGRLWLLSGGPFDLGLLACNTTTARTTAVPYEVSEELAAEIRLAGWFPSLAADAYVALIASPTRVRVFETDGVDGVRTLGDLHAGDLLTEQNQHGGMLDDDSRVLVGGATLYVVRNRSGRGAGFRGVTTMVFRRDHAPNPRASPFLQVDREPALLNGPNEVVLQYIDVTHEGLLLSAMALERKPGGEQPRGILWISSADGESEGQRASGHPPWVEDLMQPRRWAATRAGRWLFIPTDRGAELVAVEAPADGPAPR